MISAIIKAFLEVLKPITEEVLFKSLMKISDHISELESSLLVEEGRPLDEQDDVYIPMLKAQLKIAVEAFLRQRQVGAVKNATPVA